jgi:hypothetical protein
MSMHVAVWAICVTVLPAAVAMKDSVVVQGSRDLAGE